MQKPGQHHEAFTRARLLGGGHWLKDNLVTNKKWFLVTFSSCTMLTKDSSSVAVMVSHARLSETGARSPLDDTVLGDSLHLNGGEV